MDIVYPLFFTRGGRGVRWYEPHNRISVTIRYANSQQSLLRTDRLEIHHLTQPFTFEPESVSGYFIENDEMIRVTNLIGYDGNSILKQCPQCSQVKQIDEFDYSGRFTNGQRDQSNCKSCRSQY